MIETMKRFEAVIFDMDGVIFDSELLVIKCWQVVADKYGIKNIEDTCHKCLGLNKDATKELMLGVYGADFPYDEYKAEMSALFHEQAAGGKLPMKLGVTGLLQTLKKKGCAGIFYQESSCRTGASGCRYPSVFRSGNLRGYGKAEQTGAGYLSGSMQTDPCDAGAGIRHRGFL